MTASVLKWIVFFVTVYVFGSCLSISLTVGIFVSFLLSFHSIENDFDSMFLHVWPIILYFRKPKYTFHDIMCSWLDAVCITCVLHVVDSEHYTYHYQYDASWEWG